MVHPHGPAHLFISAIGHFSASCVQHTETSQDNSDVIYTCITPMLQCKHNAAFEVCSVAAASFMSHTQQVAELHGWSVFIPFRHCERWIPM